MKNNLFKLILMLGFLACSTKVAMAAEISAAGSSSLTVSALLITAFLTAMIHTIAGPDHYLPFIAIAKSRDYSLKKTLFWTFVCGIGHIASALIVALLFIYFSHWLSEANFLWIEENRGNIAAYLLIGLGLAYLLWALRHRWMDKKLHKHHYKNDDANSKSITPWVLFIIFVLGPCEALLPILTASSVMGSAVVISSTIIFSLTTIITMMVLVTLGVLGVSALRFRGLEKYAHEIAGATIMLCGIAIICGL